MVDVGVREQYGVQFLRIEGEAAVALESFLAPALVEPALQQQAVAVNLQQVLRPRHRLRRTMKSDPHSALLLEKIELLCSSRI